MLYFGGRLFINAITQSINYRVPATDLSLLQALREYLSKDEIIELDIFPEAATARLH